IGLGDTAEVHVHDAGLDLFDRRVTLPEIIGLKGALRANEVESPGRIGLRVRLQFEPHTPSPRVATAETPGEPFPHQSFRGRGNQLAFLRRGLINRLAVDRNNPIPARDAARRLPQAGHQEVVPNPLHRNRRVYGSTSGSGDPAVSVLESRYEASQSPVEFIS